jgi:hypothetical protein
MPLLGVIMTFAALSQWFFYLKTWDDMNNMIKLLARGAWDSIPIMALLFIWMLAFTMCFVQLGSFFDDGGNFGKSYDTHYNDYPYVDHGLTMIIA